MRSSSGARSARPIAATRSAWPAEPSTPWARAADRPVVAAALLHDCGKSASGFGTFGRVGATLVIAVAGRARVIGWSDARGVRGHGSAATPTTLASGARCSSRRGAPTLTVAWAAEHHLPSSAWTVPEPVGAALKAADDD